MFAGPAAVAPCFQRLQAQAPPPLNGGGYAFCKLLYLTQRPLDADRRRAAPQIIDARRREVYDAAPHVLPTATWQDSPKSADWIDSLDRDRPVVIACKAAHEMSQMWRRTFARRLRRQRAGRRLCGLERSRLAAGRQGRARTLRTAPAQPVGDPAAAEDRPHRLPVADSPFPRRAGAHPVRRSTRGPCRRARRPAPSRSTSKASRFRTKGRAAASTPCSSCSDWRASRRWRGWR